MSRYQENPMNSANNTPMNAMPRWPTTRRVVLRRNKPVTIRLGGNKSNGGLKLEKLLKNMKLRWLKQQYSCMFKRLRKSCINLAKHITEADKCIESLQQKLIMEAAFSVPGIHFPIYPSCVL